MPDLTVEPGTERSITVIVTNTGTDPSVLPSVSVNTEDHVTTTIQDAGRTDTGTDDATDLDSVLPAGESRNITATISVARDADGDENVEFVITDLAGKRAAATKEIAYESVSADVQTSTREAATGKELYVRVRTTPQRTPIEQYSYTVTGQGEEIERISEQSTVEADLSTPGEYNVTVTVAAAGDRSTVASDTVVIEGDADSPTDSETTTSSGESDTGNADATGAGFTALIVVLAGALLVGVRQVV